MFNKAEYVGHMEATIEDFAEEKNLQFQANPDTHTTNSIPTQRMMSEQVEPDDFELPCQKLKPSIEAKLEALLKEYASQFTQDKTSIGMTPNRNNDRYRNLWVSIAKTLSNCHETLSMGKGLNRKATCSKSDMRMLIQLVRVVQNKQDKGKGLVLDHCTLSKVTRKFIWPMPKEKDIFSQLNVSKNSPHLIFQQDSTIFL